MSKTKHSEESEKSLERYLTAQARSMGYISLKYFNPVSTGWPDRMVMMPAGQICWCELKSKGERPRPLQAHRHASLRDLGHRVYTCDTKEKIDRMLRIETNRMRKIRAYMTTAKEGQEDGAE